MVLLRRSYPAMITYAGIGWRQALQVRC